MIALTLLKGGADTGFNRVLPEEYKARLFHVKKEESKKITCSQVSMKRGNLTSDDVFIIDNGLRIYQVSSLLIVQKHVLSTTDCFRNQPLFCKFITEKYWFSEVI